MGRAPGPSADGRAPLIAAAAPSPRLLEPSQSFDLLRIVHLDTALDLRGGQHQLLNLARGLRQRGHEQLIVCPETSALEANARGESFRVFALPAHDPGRAHGTLQLRQLLQAERFDLIHGHDGRGQTIAWLASLGLRVRSVASRRVTFLPRRLASHRIKYGRSCDAIIAVSNFVQRLLVASGVPESKIEVIPDGVEIPAEPPGAEARAKHRAARALSAENFVVGHVGAFTREKGQDIAVEAVLRLALKLPKVKLLLAGDGPLRSSPLLQAKVRDSRGRITLAGYVEDLTDFFACLDLFIQPSRTEGLGSSALMAMAHGIAVIVSRTGGLPEIVAEGETGWLVPPESPQALADAIIAAASDRARLSQYAAAARERARRFSIDIMVERTEALYRRLCQ